MKESIDKTVISKVIIDRLPLYFRTLRLSRDEGMEIISSEELGQRLGISPEQIRKDLASFGQFGKKGVGYHIMDLIFNIGKILGLDKNWQIAIVGLGHLGWALAHYQKFDSLGFKLVAIFDNDPNKIGQCIDGIQVSNLDCLKEVMQEQMIHIGIISVPGVYAQEVADQLVDAGIRGIWNFAPRKIKVPDTVRIINEDLSVGLSSLSFHLARQSQIEE
ncbi:redox-sensing transcriptional repressor Rex [Pelosinus sp. sgz500959]|uniref:redox-sensing transcriptional repressor Rex n=1 Tax=Pelosinus sp. sgz500959 TaxID=3242472 RepID=UPI003670B24A